MHVHAVIYMLLFSHAVIFTCCYLHMLSSFSHAVIFICCHFHMLSFSHMQAYMIAQHFTCSLCIGMYLYDGECVFKNASTYQNLHFVPEFCVPDCVISSECVLQNW